MPVGKDGLRLNVGRNAAAGLVAPVVIEEDGQQDA
jgi:hypothetical protein